MMHVLLAGWMAAFALVAQPKPGAGSIEGHVVNSITGAPLRRATVVLTSTASIRLVADSDAEGKFQFTGLPAGTYRLSAGHSGFLDHAARRPISLTANQQVTDAEIRLPVAAAITGRVLDEDGEPLEGARITAFKQIYRNGNRQWDGINNVALTNGAGEYRLSNLRPGRYLVLAMNLRQQVNNRYGDPPTSFYLPVYHPNALTQSRAMPVDVGPGADARGIDVQLFKVAKPPSVHVSGKVIGMPDTKIPISVSLVTADGAPFGGGSGMASPPGYTFDLTAPPGQYALLGAVYAEAPEFYGSANLTVTADMAGVVLTMSPAPEVAGRITVAEGDGAVNLQNVRIDVTRIGTGPLSQARSDSAGKFVLRKPLRPGHYSIVDVRSVPEGCFVREVKLGDREISWDDFEIATSAPLEIVLSNTAGAIAGTVADADGKPFAGALVTLIPTDGKSRPVKQSVEEDSGFHFTGLRPGKYQLFAWEEVDDDLWQDPDFRKKYEKRVTEVTLGPKETQNTQLRAIAADEMQ